MEIRCGQEWGRGVPHRRTQTVLTDALRDARWSKDPEARWLKVSAIRIRRDSSISLHSSIDPRRSSTASRPGLCLSEASPSRGTRRRNSIVRHRKHTRRRRFSASRLRSSTALRRRCRRRDTTVAAASTGVAAAVLAGVVVPAPAVAVVAAAPVEAAAAPIIANRGLSTLIVGKTRETADQTLIFGLRASFLGPFFLLRPDLRRQANRRRWPPGPAASHTYRKEPALLSGSPVRSPGLPEAPAFLCTWRRSA